MIFNIHSECFISAQHTCATLTFGYNIGSWSLKALNVLPKLHFLLLKIGRSKSTFLKNGPFRPLFLYFHLFNTVDSKEIFRIKVCWWLDSYNWPQKRPLYQLSYNHCPENLLLVKYQFKVVFGEHFVAIGYEEIGLRLPMHYYPINGLPIFGAYGCLQCATFYQGI